MALPGPLTVDLDFPELLPSCASNARHLANAALAASSERSGPAKNQTTTAAPSIRELDARLAEEEHSWALHRLLR